jgi:hypothetical protein
MLRLLVGCLFVGFMLASLSAEETMPIRVGIIGLDTSHVVAFTKIMNEDRDERFRPVQVVAAFPGGSPEFPLSRDRVEGFTKQVRELGVEIVDSIDSLLSKVDAVLLESVDGRATPMPLVFLFVQSLFARLSRVAEQSGHRCNYGLRYLQPIANGAEASRFAFLWCAWCGFVV